LFVACERAEPQPGPDQDAENRAQPQPRNTPEPGDTAEPTADVEWERPRFDERREERHEFVDERVTEMEGLGDEVLAAMRHVPRHLFVPTGQRGAAYVDRALPIGHGQTISQPSLVAFMTEKLQLDPADRVLEIGTGSGYQAAILSELTPHVYTIEIIEELAEQAKERFDELGYETIEVMQGDGYFGWPEHAPFDAIIVTAAPGHVPPPLLKQLKKGGRMVIPVGAQFAAQRLILITKDEDGDVSTESLMPVRFVPMTGRAQEEAE
jgi:protein-L-isoaspartate(D-aspartate) O-methyltransferase